MFEVRNGDLRKLGLLFDRHHRLLYNFFLKLTGSREASEDLVQEVFLRMLKYRHTYKGASQFRTWMFQIARNARYDFQKKQRNEESWDDDLHEFVSTTPGASEKLEREQETRMLHTALARLPEDDREVLVLSRFHGIKYKEIAEILGCLEGTVKAKVHRAIKKLRDVFFELSGEEAS